jgi:prolyl-tRNA synthetase
VAGYIGPVGLKARVLVDRGVGDRGYIVGANKKDAHLRDVVLGRDFEGQRVDASDVREGDLCPRCKTGTLQIKRGVEVGNIFAYGTYYSDKMNATFLSEDGTRKPFVGGSYGIGVGRAVQTIIETHHDDQGIVWPPQVAPYHAHVIALPVNDDDVRAKAEALVSELEKRDLEVLYDDRDESAGVKFADADLIGIPLRVTVSKRNLKENAVELKLRTAVDSEMVPLASAADRIAAVVGSWPR